MADEKPGFVARLTAVLKTQRSIADQLGTLRARIDGSPAAPSVGANPQTVSWPAGLDGVLQELEAGQSSILQDLADLTDKF